jgi:hypothetical protein
MFDKDAQACYNRMIPSQTAMISRRAGMPQAAAKTFLRILLHMEYFVWTAYGVQVAGIPTLFNGSLA